MTLPSFSPWCHQMSPRFGTFKGTSGTFGSVLVPVPKPLAFPHRAAEGWGHLQKNRRQDPWEVVPPLRGPAPTDKETVCVAPGQCGVPLTSQEPWGTSAATWGSWGDLQRDGSQAAGAMARSSSTRPVLTTNQYLVPLPRAVTWYESYLAQSSLNLWSHLVFQLLSSGLQQTLICHRLEEASQVPPVKTLLLNYPIF